MMNPTFTVKYLPATTTKGSRLKARSLSGKTVTVPYPYEEREGNQPWGVFSLLMAELAYSPTEYRAYCGHSPSNSLKWVFMLVRRD